MTAPALRPSDWLLVQRSDADEDDRARVDELARTTASEVVRTDGPEALDAVIDRLDARGLVVCGGDGSFHVAVDRLEAMGRLSDVPMALFPAGTGNDLAHTLDLPLDPAEMATLLQAGTPRRLDVLDVGARGLAVNALHAGVGVDAAVRSQDLPDGLGALAYPLGALLAGVRAEGFDGHVEVDGRPLRPEEGDQALIVLVMNGRTIGGGHPLAPDADPGDGLLDVVVAHATGMTARAAFGLAVMRGTHVDRADVAVATGHEVHVRGHGLTWNVDGELWLDEPIDDLAIRVRPGALTMLVP